MVMLLGLAQEPIVVLEPATRVEYGQTVPDWSAAPTETVVPGCLVQPLSGPDVDLLPNRAAASGALMVLAPAGTVVSDRARVRVPSRPGRDYEVTGEERAWPSPTGGLDHVELVLVRVEG